MAALHNRVNRRELKKKVQEEPFRRTTVSFYRYVSIAGPEALRDELFRQWAGWNILGRIYLSSEGINAQMCIPEHNYEAFINHLNNTPFFKNIPVKIAIEDDGKSFYKLTIKVRRKLVADGLEEGTFDVGNVGKHLTANAFNEAMEKAGTLVVDMRNHYESEVGHFENAILPPSDTFRQELPMVAEMLKGREEQKILLYCTGGIRCEKASAYLKHLGFRDVNQLYGGIIEYAREVKKQGLKSKFIGKNFVFDNRMGERITNDIISRCHQCDKPCDTHVNCSNEDCHLLFIQCPECSEKYKGCCTPQCTETVSLHPEEQRKRRKGKKKLHAHAVYKSRLRPNLREILRNNGEIHPQSDT